MGKYKDIAGILLLIIVGMFIPFIVSIVITFNLDATNLENWLKIGSTFGWFLIIFGIELIVVVFYYNITSKIAKKRIKDINKKNR